MKQRIAWLLNRVKRDGLSCTFAGVVGRKFRKTGVGLHLAERAAQRSGGVVPVYLAECKSLFYLPNRQVDDIQNILFRSREFYELHSLIALQKLVGPCDTIVDVGANIGNHSLFFALHFPTRHVVAFRTPAGHFLHPAPQHRHQWSGAGNMCGELWSEQHGGLRGYRSWRRQQQRSYLFEHGCRGEHKDGDPGQLFRGVSSRHQFHQDRRGRL